MSDRKPAGLRDQRDQHDQRDEQREREELEAEREFLLRSLDDLDAELLAGNIDPDTYRVLHDDYTARASAVIRSIADGVERRTPGSRRVPPLMRGLTIGGIVVFALLAAFLLAHTVGQRSAGQQITGDAQSNRTSTTLSQVGQVAAAKAAAEANPNDYSARINYARSLVSIDPADSIKEFVAASKLDPKQPEPYAYTGWLTALVARQVTTPATKQELLDAAARSLDKAISVDPAYAPSYVFKGVILAQFENKPCQGAIALQQYLAGAPTDDVMRPLALSALSDAVKAGKCPSPSSTPTTKP
jgi:tetratricopeptide (TPR) repeat protein